MIYFCDETEFSASLLQSSVSHDFRNHNNILIYDNVETVVLLIFLGGTCNTFFPLIIKGGNTTAEKLGFF